MIILRGFILGAIGGMIGSGIVLLIFHYLGCAK
jgi:hypothetical protein